MENAEVEEGELAGKGVGVEAIGLNPTYREFVRTFSTPIPASTVEHVLQLSRSL